MLNKIAELLRLLLFVDLLAWDRGVLVNAHFELPRRLCQLNISQRDTDRSGVVLVPGGAATPVQLVEVIGYSRLIRLKLADKYIDFIAVPVVLWFHIAKEKDSFRLRDN